MKTKIDDITKNRANSGKPMAFSDSNILATQVYFDQCYGIAGVLVKEVLFPSRSLIVWLYNRP